MQNSEKFLEDLRALISIRSVYTDEIGKLRCIDYCQRRLEESTPGRRIFRDHDNNLISQPDTLEASQDHIFLSAHVDTVDASREDWHHGIDPFTATDTDTHILGRGSSDCKAGVALMLWMASYLHDTPLSDRYSLLFSFQEEGNERKSSTTIAQNFGSGVKISNKNNFILCLENTTSLVDDQIKLSAYDTERCNVFVEVSGNLNEIWQLLCERQEWNIVAIQPKQEFEKASFLDATDLSLSNGHSATLKGMKNPVYSALRSYKDCQDIALLAGSFKEPSVIRNCVRTCRSEPATLHKALINIRSENEIERELEALKSLDWREHRPVLYGLGSNRRSHPLSQSFCSKLMNVAGRLHVPFTVETNPGRSDASALWNTVDEGIKERTAILTVGPGTRSHADGAIMRRTHGENEGFHIFSGMRVCDVLTQLVAEVVT